MLLACGLSCCVHTLSPALPLPSNLPQERFKWSDKSSVHVPDGKAAADAQPDKPAAAGKAGGKKDKGERQAQEGGGREAPAAAKRGKAATPEAAAAEAPAEPAGGKKESKRPGGKGAAAAAGAAAGAAAEGELQAEEGDKDGEARKALDPARRGLGPSLMVRGSVLHGGTVRGVPAAALHCCGT